MRNRERMIKACYMAVWSGIFLLAAYILIKGGIVFGTQDKFKVVEKLGNYIISEYSIYIEKQSIQLMHYTLQCKEKSETNVIKKYVSYLSPIQGLILHTKAQESTEEIIKVTGQMNQILLKKKVKGNIFPVGNIGFIFGESYYEDDEMKEDVVEAMAETISNKKLIAKLKKDKKLNFLIKNFYIVDSSTSIDKSIFRVDKLLKKDFKLKKNPEKPQILIYHTHATSETFADSRSGEVKDTVVGVGDRLAKILSEDYGYNVIHDQSPYDIVNGKTDRNRAYNAALDNVKRILKENPSIKVVIDIHRDGVPGTNKRVAVINGKKTAQIMLFNGLSRNKLGPIEYLHNPNLQANLAFSLQVKLLTMEKYPDLSKRNYLKSYRYNTQVCERSLLVELGDQNNTVMEAKNAMEPFADVLDQILSGD